ncbi:MAG TPA: MFS transporter [Verrucomicrobiae bacterium]|nr:MFS transporter [Verrucomicrobiae bacterium]
MILTARKERGLLLLLAAIQFTAVLDFLIVLPLGPEYMRVMGITAKQFGIMVSSYAISAGVFGAAGGFVLDLFDRKRALLGLFFGFTVGTLCCALAPNYPLLVAARIIAGGFGGVTGALILAVVGDVIPEKRRGAAMGWIMSAFSAASVGGVPIGLWLARQFTWHAPFFALAGLGAVILAATVVMMPALRGHFAHGAEHPVQRMLAVVTERNHQIAFAFMFVLTLAGAMIFPYIPTYMAVNVGLTDAQLGWIYIAGGACTLVTLNWIGRWADRAGKFRVYALMSLAATIPILTITNLPRAPVALGIAVTTIFMICMSGRAVPAMAMMTAAVKPKYRGGFMSANSSVQQFAAGIGTCASGLIIGPAHGALPHFTTVGLIAAPCCVGGIYFARLLKSAEGPPGPVTPEDEARAEGVGFEM